MGEVAKSGFPGDAADFQVGGLQQDFGLRDAFAADFVTDSAAKMLLEQPMEGYCGHAELVRDLGDSKGIGEMSVDVGERTADDRIRGGDGLGRFPDDDSLGRNDAGDRLARLARRELIVQRFRRFVNPSGCACVTAGRIFP